MPFSRRPTDDLPGRALGPQVNKVEQVGRERGPMGPATCSPPMDRQTDRQTRLIKLPSRKICMQAVKTWILISSTDIKQVVTPCQFSLLLKTD